MTSHPLLKLLEANPERVMAIHYASTMVERQAAVTAIAVVHMEDFKTFSWSRRDFSEQALFQAFFDHLMANPRTLVGWNTSGPRYGYEALKQRSRSIIYRSLPDLQQYDLDDVFERLLGQAYCEHPKLANMSERNSLSMKDFLEGATEAQLGLQGDFAPLERSSERKARNVARLLLLASAGKLTQATHATDTFWAYQHPLVVQHAKPRFDAGLYADSVLVTMVELNARVKEHVRMRTGMELDGRDLMMQALSVRAGSPPVVQVVPALASDSDLGMQEGYKFMLAGAMQAIRNPKAHGNLVIDPQRCRLLLSCASLLISKLDEAQVDVKPR